MLTSMESPLQIFIFEFFIIIIFINTAPTQTGERQGCTTMRSSGKRCKVADGNNEDDNGGQDDGSKKQKLTSKHKGTAGMGQWRVTAMICGGSITYPPSSDAVVERTMTIYSLIVIVVIAVRRRPFFYGLTSHLSSIPAMRCQQVTTRSTCHHGG